MEPFNDFLKFFLCALVLHVIALFQYVLSIIRALLDPPPPLAFADVCTLANCSVLIFTDLFKGYYIHGKAPWGKSDLPLSWLKTELDYEAKGKLPARSLGGVRAGGRPEPRGEGSGTQRLSGPSTYELFITVAVREKVAAWLGSGRALAGTA